MSRRQLDRGSPGLPGDEPGDDSGCTILHVDMDAFFASVEERDRPELRGGPVIVGGAGARGVVSAANYAARAFGIHSAMPMSRARRMCPQAVVVPPSHGKYGEVSAAVMQVLRSVTPEVEPLALDEAFLDVSGAVRRLGPPGEIAALIRRRVHAEQDLTCSVGAASTKFVAKLASTHCKPDGMLVVPDDRVVEFLHPLPCGALWGVGDRTEEALQRLGLRTVGDIAHTPETVLQRELGQALGAHLAALAWGRDPRPVVTSTPDKSIGHETTFDRDVADPEVIRRALLRLSESTGARLRATGQVCRTVSVKLRRADFTTFTRSRTLPEPTDGTQRIYATACALYEASGVEHRRLRLVGVRAENLTDAATAPHQMTFLDEQGQTQRETGWSEADRAIDRVTRKFGRGAVRPASLVRPDADAEPPSAP